MFLPANEYRALVAVKPIVNIIKREVISLVEEETMATSVPIWNVILSHIRTRVIFPTIFWNQISDIIADSAMDKSLKEYLMFQLWSAFGDMAERVITMESAQEVMSRPKPAAASAIKALPKYLLTSSGDDAMMCVICMEEITIGSTFTMMPCSHEFHRPCIKQWLAAICAHCADSSCIQWRKKSIEGLH
ncbi:hypothetical protein Tsubulata_043681 [Turnera subulata]|uniref:RING-type domain-containing protein n=1 Tax=Turnera subulata TaxID=218843 RepID=A0A9Q0FJV0_9ROSI|nr:hypothetical protein Tsubulata_043681 [Turnera subulata]